MSRPAGTQRFLVAVALIVFTASAAGRKPQTGFLNRTVTLGRTTYGYQVYVPSNWTPKTKWPVILFLHGAGERGEDGLKQTEVGIGSAIRQHRERFPCLVVMPQCRQETWWADSVMEAQALKVLEQVLKVFNGDPQRVYLTGLSMGGYGTWSMAARHPGRFAALVPISGGILPLPNAPRPQGIAAPEFPADPYATTAQKIGKTPVWVFHGAADPLVPVSESRKMVEALQGARGNARYTEYEGVGHNAWEKAYAEPEFLPWLLSHRLNKAPK